MTEKTWIPVRHFLPSEGKYWVKWENYEEPEQIATLVKSWWRDRWFINGVRFYPTHWANMSYTEGEEFMGKEFTEFKDITKRLGAIEKAHSLSLIIGEQAAFAEQRLIEATNQGVRDEQHKWSGYLQALRFIQSEL